MSVTLLLLTFIPLAIFHISTTMTATATAIAMSIERPKQLLLYQQNGTATECIIIARVERANMG